MSRNQGFGAAEIIVAIVVLAIGVFLGYRAWETFARVQKEEAAISEQADQPQDITDTSDELDQTEVDESALSELDAELVY